MLTRLIVQGFKNLMDVDIHFGPLTCIAGPNGVGKSNLFDAILFLQALADKPIIEAAMAVRGGQDMHRLFTANGNGRMLLTAEMLIPKTGTDSFGQRAEASSTFVRYSVTLRCRNPKTDLVGGDIELEEEELTYLKKSDAPKILPFFHKPAWRNSVLHADRRADYISTDKALKIVKLHQDRRREEGKKKRGGATWEFPLENLPRTVLSSAQNAKEAPTAVMVRQEMRSWSLLQLEPSALRQPDEFRAPSRLSPTGAHLPATLYRLAKQASATGEDPDTHESRIYATAANRVAELVEGVRELRVDCDSKRRLFTLLLKDRHGDEFPASSLSDGTLRFLALTLLKADPEVTGILCMEEPENGIHPERIPAMISLLKDIAVDTDLPVDHDNTLRQVIINTHSPTVVGLVDDESLLFSELFTISADHCRFQALQFRCLEETKRAKTSGLKTITRGQLKTYLKGGFGEIEDMDETTTTSLSNKPKRVVDRLRNQLSLPFN